MATGYSKRSLPPSDWLGVSWAGSVTRVGVFNAIAPTGEVACVELDHDTQFGTARSLRQDAVGFLHSPRSKLFINQKTYHIDILIRHCLLLIRMNNLRHLYGDFILILFGMSLPLLVLLALTGIFEYYVTFMWFICFVGIALLLGGACKLYGAYGDLMLILFSGTLLLLGFFGVFPIIFPSIICIVCVGLLFRGEKTNKQRIVSGKRLLLHGAFGLTTAITVLAMYTLYDLLTGDPLWGWDVAMRVLTTFLSRPTQWFPLGAFLLFG